MALVPIAATAQRSPVLTFRTGETIYLRWRGVHRADVDGYNVYRRERGGDWQRLTATPLHRVERVAEARAIAGHGAELFLTMLGAGDPPRDPDRSMYTKVFADPKGDAFFSAICLVNPELGLLLGEVFRDTSFSREAVLEYRVTVLSNGGEEDLATTYGLDGSGVDSIPEVGSLAADSDAEQIALAWERDTAALAAGRIVSYNVYRSDSLLGPYERVNLAALLPATISTGTSSRQDTRQQFVDRFLETGGRYFYNVRAVNPFGFEGDPSPTVEAVTRRTRPPSAPRNLRATRFGSGARLEWDVDTSAKDNSHEVFRSGSQAEPFVKVHPLSIAVRSAAKFWIDPRIEDGGIVRYFVQAVDANGNRSASTDTLTFVAPDERAPAPPQSVEAIAGEGIITIRWRPGSDPDILGYQVERASGPAFTRLMLLNGTPTAATSHVDTVDKQSELTYGYVVYAVDRRYNRSKGSAMARARLRDVVAPQRPIITALQNAGDSIVLLWTGGDSPDLERYDIYRAKGREGRPSVVASRREREFRDRPAGSGKVAYSVVAIDSSGNASPMSRPFSILIERESVPPRPDSGSVQSGPSAIMVRWSVVSSPAIAGFHLIRIRARDSAVVSLADLGPERRDFLDTHGPIGEEYTYIIRSRDSAWRFSEPLIVRYKPR